MISAAVLYAGAMETAADVMLRDLPFSSVSRSRSTIGICSSYGSTSTEFIVSASRSGNYGYGVGVPRSGSRCRSGSA